MKVQQGPSGSQLATLVKQQGAQPGTSGGLTLPVQLSQVKTMGKVTTGGQSKNMPLTVQQQQILFQKRQLAQNTNKIAQYTQVSYLT